MPACATLCSARPPKAIGWPRHRPEVDNTTIPMPRRVVPALTLVSFLCFVLLGFKAPFGGGVALKVATEITRNKASRELRRAAGVTDSACCEPAAHARQEATGLNVLAASCGRTL